MLSLADAWEALAGKRPAWAESSEISHFTVDSRTVVPGALFIALQGEHQDGHAFIGDAIARGASAVIAEARAREQGLGGTLNLIDVAGLQPNPAPGLTLPIGLIVPSSLAALQQLARYWRSRLDGLETVGITGSVGKSSTKELVYTVLRQHFRTVRSVGNLNNEIGLPLSLLQIGESCQRAVLEMGMYATGEITLLCDLARPRIGVVTNVAPVHLERLGSIERIAQAKSELPRALPPHGTAVLNYDDERVRSMAEVTQAKVLFFGLDRRADVWADDIESHGLHGISFALHFRRDHLHVTVPLLGRHSVHTALAAAAVGLAEGMDWEEILRGLQDTDAQLRLIAVRTAAGATVLDDTYNASPPSTLAALNLMNELTGRKIAVLGDMLELGSFEEEGHRLVGKRAAEVASIVVAVGELGRVIGESAAEAGSAQVLYAANAAAAVAVLASLTKEGDIVLVKGSRGAHLEQIVEELARIGGGA